MGHYIANVRDLEFNLLEVLDIGAVLGTGRYSDLDVDTVRTILAEAARLAEGPIAESFGYADRNPPVFDPNTHSISVPDELAKTVQYLYAAAHQDDAVAQRVSGADHDMAHRVDDLLLPIVKGVGSERAYEILTESLQTLGGSGFLVDYPLEQYIRDAKIDSLYEGTTAIQALDFFFRKIVRDHGKALQFVLAQVTHTVENIDPSLKPQAELLRTALDDITAMTGALTGYLMSAAQHSSDIYKVGLGSVRYLLAVGDLLIGWRLLVLAGVAHAALADGPSQNDEAFYRGKIAVAAFFAKNMLPKLTGVRSVIENIDDDIMRVPEDAF